MTGAPAIRVRRHQRKGKPTKPERATRDRVPLAAITASDDGDLFMEDGSEVVKIKERDEE